MLKHAGACAKRSSAATKKNVKGVSADIFGGVRRDSEPTLPLAFAGCSMHCLFVGGAAVELRAASACSETSMHGAQIAALVFKFGLLLALAGSTYSLRGIFEGVC